MDTDNDALNGSQATGDTGGYAAQMRDAKRRIVMDALVRTSGNRTRAARALGVARPSLVRMMRDLGVEVPRRNGRPSA